MRHAVERSRYTSRAGLAVGTVLLILGLLVLALPYLLEASFSLSSEGEKELVDAARDLIAQEDMSWTESDSSTIRETGGDDGASRAATLYLQAYPVLKEYNESLLVEGQKINDPFADQEGIQMLSGISMLDGLIGSVSIPAMGCDLPLRYGASYEHMAAGAVVVSGTSIPLGEASSNCVIAAHRSWGGALMFRNIEDVQIGDELILRTPWDVLSYRAVEMRVIGPSDTDAVAIQKGRDLVTLVTCHPYGRNYERYVVYFEREPSGDAAETSRSDAVSWLSRFPSLDVGKTTFPEDALRTVGAALLVALALSLLIRIGRRRRQQGVPCR